MQATDWQLITVKPGPMAHYESVRFLEADEWARYQVAVDRLHEISDARLPLRSLLHAHAEFERHFEGLEKCDLEALSRRPISDWAIPLNQRLAAVLTAIQSLLDNTRTRLARSKVKKYLAAFDAARRSRFSKSGAYRIAYFLRHYVQHCGPALTATRVESSWGATTARSTHALIARCVRDRLEAGIDWKRARADLMAMPAEFDVRSILVEAVGELLELDHEVFQMERELLEDAITTINGLLDEARSAADVGIEVIVARYDSAGQDPATGREMNRLTIAEPPRSISWP